MCLWTAASHTLLAVTKKGVDCRGRAAPSKGHEKYYVMPAEQTKMLYNSTALTHFGLFKVQDFCEACRKNLALAMRTLRIASRHSNGY